MTGNSKKQKEQQVEREKDCEQQENRENQRNTIKHKLRSRQQQDKLEKSYTEYKENGGKSFWQVIGNAGFLTGS